MRILSAAIRAALQARALVARDFLWIVARDRATGAPFAVGFWSDAGTIEAQVVDPDTGLSVTRTFAGSGTLISTSDIPLVSNITVRNVTIQMSQIHEAVEQTVRGYDLKQARVEIFRGLFDPASRLLVAPAPSRFVVFVDEVEIKTPSENEPGGVTLTCASHTQEMTRSNPAKRSHEDQLLRDPTDNFFQDAAVVDEWDLSWGSKTKKVGSSK